MMFVFHHVAISVSNPQRSIAFYQQLGFKPVFEWAADDGSLQIIHLDLAGTLLELFAYKNFEPLKQQGKKVETDLPRIGVKHFALRVQSIEDAKQHVLEKGIADQIEIKRGRTGIDYFFIQDPDGIWVEIVEDNRQR
ncbi:MAG: VOC family protein [Pseudomonadota bacterium]